jgi:hypothetical protein
MTARLIAAAAALFIAGQTAAQDAPAGTDADADYAALLWEIMETERLAGDNMIFALPYEGLEPHGLMLETFYTTAEIDGHSGALVVKRNYGPEGVSGDEVLSDPAGHLGAITIMFKREEGYDSDNADWFYAKYLPDGTLDQNPAGMRLAGRVGKGAEAGCIPCHAGAAPDFLFTTDAELAMD